MSDAAWVDTSRQGPPPSQVHIDTLLAEALMREQLPHLAHHTLGQRFDGWDMAVFRVGESHALRLPRTAPAVTSLAVEVRALGEVGTAWTFPHPRIVHLGAAGCGYPWPWAVTTWLDGQTADLTPLDADAGTEVGKALAQVHQPAAPDAPFNVEQSITLAERSEQLEWALPTVAGLSGPRGERLDETAARALWADALAAPPPGAPVWSHADGHGSNVLGSQGRFAGIIDWGKMAACDRAVDLAFLYTAMPATGVSQAIASYRAITSVEDAGLEARAAGIALTKAAAWATLDRQANVVMAWRVLEGLGLLLP